MFLKAQFTPKQNKKQKIYPQINQDIDEFVSSREQIWRNVALHYLLTKGSSAVNGCRQNFTSNLHNSCPSSEVKSLFVIN